MEIENGSRFRVYPGDPQGFLGDPKCIICVLVSWLSRALLQWLFATPEFRREAWWYLCVSILRFIRRRPWLQRLGWPGGEDLLVTV